LFAVVFSELYEHAPDLNRQVAAKLLADPVTVFKQFFVYSELALHVSSFLAIA